MFGGGTYLSVDDWGGNHYPFDNRLVKIPYSMYREHQYLSRCRVLQIDYNSQSVEIMRAEYEHAMQCEQRDRQRKAHQSHYYDACVYHQQIFHSTSGTTIQGPTTEIVVPLKKPNVEKHSFNLKKLYWARYLKNKELSLV
jgi:hypothetical protein